MPTAGSGGPCPELVVGSSLPRKPSQSREPLLVTRQPQILVTRKHTGISDSLALEISVGDGGRVDRARKEDNLILLEWNRSRRLTFASGAHLLKRPSSDAAPERAGPSSNQLAELPLRTALLLAVSETGREPER